MSPAKLSRRGFKLGEIDLAQTSESNLWALGGPTLISQICQLALSSHSDHIEQSVSLYQSILAQQACDELFDQKPYSSRLHDRFESLGSSVSEGDEQEIETVFFDAIKDGGTLAEDLWVKVSWLSFYADDASLRFRFSFGADFVEDVAADKSRQQHAAQLTDEIFPESAIITQNNNLVEQVRILTGMESFSFTERIVYFNAPQGGAYLHHDRERGHAGVIYAQLTGATCWLALPRYQLCEEIEFFVQQCQRKGAWPESLNAELQDSLLHITSGRSRLIEQLESFSNTALINLINETEAFVQHLISHGHARVVNTGDAILLPQANDDDCCWHSVFCLGDTTGQALSFAIRED